MKKLLILSVCALTLGLTSCSEDDVTDIACNTVRDSLKTTVQSAIDEYNNEGSKALCEAAKTAIDSYKSNKCGDGSFDTALNNLPDCSTIKN